MQVTFHQWGLRSTESSDGEVGSIGHYGAVSGELLTLPDIMQKLGHDRGRFITALKLDCEGCEYATLRDLFCLRASLPPILSLSIEFHFPISMRVVESVDVERIRYAGLFLRSGRYASFQTKVHAGTLSGYTGQPRWFHPDLTMAGFEVNCCFMYGFVMEDFDRQIAVAQASAK